MSEHQRRVLRLQYPIRRFRVRNALRAALACALCAGVNAALQLEYGYVSMFYVIAVFVKYREELLEKMGERFLGVVISIFLAMVIANAFLQSWPFFVACALALVSTLFYRFADNRLPYSAIMGGIYAAIVLTSATDSLASATEFARAALIQYVLGLAAITLVNTAMPYQVEQSLQVALARVFDDIATLLEGEAARLQGRPPPAPDIWLGYDTFSALLNLVGYSKRQRRHAAFPENLYLRLLTRARFLFIRTRALRQFSGEEVPGEADSGLSVSAAAVLRVLALRTRTLSDAVFAGSAAPPPAAAGDDDQLADFERAVRRWRAETARGLHAGHPLPAAAPTALFATAQGIRESLDQCIELHNAIRREASGLPAEPPATPERRPLLPLKPAAVHKAVQMTLVVSLVFVAYVYFEMPGGIQTVTAAVIVGSGANLGQSHLKGKLRFAGVLLGGLYGFGASLFVTAAPFFPLMLLLLMLGVFLGAYVAMGDERVAYAGQQSAFIVPMVLAASDSPQPSLEVVDPRLIGVVVGYLISMTVLHLLWPVDPAKQLRDTVGDAVAASVAVFRAILDGPGRDEKHARFTALRADIVRARQLLTDSHYQLDRHWRRLDHYPLIVAALDDAQTSLGAVLLGLSDDAPDPVLPQFMAAMAEQHRRIAALGDALADALKDPARPLPLTELKRSVDSYRESVRHFRESGVSLAYDLDQVRAYVQVSESLPLYFAALSEIATAAGESAVWKRTG